MLLKNKKISYGAKKVDKIVTGLIIGSALASIFGLAKTKKGKEFFYETKIKFLPVFSRILKITISLIGKILAFFIGVFLKKVWKTGKKD